MANTQYLAGMQCRGCGHTGPFLIEVRVQLLVHDDGTNTFADGAPSTTGSEWDSNSYCVCPTCHEDGVVFEFQCDEDA